MKERVLPIPFMKWPPPLMATPCLTKLISSSMVMRVSPQTTPKHSLFMIALSMAQTMAGISLKNVTQL